MSEGDVKDYFIFLSRGAFGAPGYGYGDDPRARLVAQAEDERQRILTLSYVPLHSLIGRGRGESRFSGWGVGEVRGCRISGG